MTSLGFIGLGNMGLALLNGFCGSPAFKDVAVYGYDISRKECGATLLDSEVEVAQRCKYILLAVKPQTVGEVLCKIAPVLTDESVIISICAGISIEYIQKKLSIDNRKLSIVQVMPNTPVMVGAGACAVAFSENISEEERLFALSIMDCCGISEIIRPDKMNEVICVNGSSPAFIYLFAKCVADYAAEQGIDPQSALNLFSQTLIGSGKMLSESGKSPDELIEQVSSKGGTTVAGLEQLYSNGFCEVVKKACQACTARAYELGKGSNN